MKRFICLCLAALIIESSPAYGGWFTKEAAKEPPRYSYANTETAGKVSSFWASHKVDISLQALSYLGVLGGALGLHFSPQWSAEFGFGGAGHFQAFGARGKYAVLKSSPLNPFIGFGFAYWKRNKKAEFETSDVSPGYLVRDLMSEADRSNLIIDERLVHGSVGLQYIFMDGRLKGFGVQVEGLLLFDIEDMVMAPTVAFGVSYFF